MIRRLRRLIRGETCRACGTRRRIRWYHDTGCCTHACLVSGMFRARIGDL